MGIKGARVYSNTLKQEIVRRLEAGERAAAIADEAGIDPKLLYDWRALYRRMGIAGLSRRRGRRRVWNGRPPSAGLTLSEPSPLTGGGPSAARPADELAEAKARIAELERLVGRQQADLHFFRETLRLWDAISHDSGAPTSTRSSKR
ncbi:MAG: helix-turn-helix domain-containing protein [Roseiarcus sp.]|uniref:transposase n=1 Tax=Roseiarcus sp. TaxID=1969460 RepID=UPI003C429C27